jgi:hypothetical protein
MKTGAWLIHRNAFVRVVQPKLRMSSLRRINADATIMLQEISRHGSRGNLADGRTDGRTSAREKQAHACNQVRIIGRNHVKTVNYAACENCRPTADETK